MFNLVRANGGKLMLLANFFEALYRVHSAVKEKGSIKLLEQHDCIEVWV